MVWGKRKKTYLITLILIIFTPFTLFIGGYTEVKAGSVVFFEMDLLLPSTSAYTPPFNVIMEENLPFIGGKVDMIHPASWMQIYPRTWNYPGPFPIPVYDNGGFDVLFIGWRYTGFDWSVRGLFDTAGFVPYGDNIYQYSCQEMDWAINNFTNSYNDTSRDHWGGQIQQFLYRDLPSIPLYHTDSVYVFNEDLSGCDGTLWHNTFMPMTDWVIPNQANFSYAIPADFTDFYIYKCNSDYDAHWLFQIYNGLIARQEGDYNWAPAIASDFHTENGLNWTVSIDPNACWADGTPLTAHDVKYSYNLQLDSNSCYDYRFWEKYLDINSIVILDNYTLQFNFIQPYAFQDSNLAAKLIPKHIWSGIEPIDHKAQALDWVVNDPSKIFGAGPYYLYDFDTTNGIIHLKKNPYHNNFSNFNDPYFEDVYFKSYPHKESAILALNAGDVDMIDTQFSIDKYEIEEQNLNHMLAKSGTIREIAVNNLHPIFGTGESCPISSPKSGMYVRKAISHIIDRQLICDDYIRYGVGTPAATFYPQIASGFNKSILPDSFDIDLAQSYMELAGYDISELEITSYVTGYNWVILLSLLGLLGFWITRKTKLLSKS